MGTLATSSMTVKVRDGPQRGHVCIAGEADLAGEAGHTDAISDRAGLHSRSQRFDLGGVTFARTLGRRWRHAPLTVGRPTGIARRLIQLPGLDQSVTLHMADRRPHVQRTEAMTSDYDARVAARGRHRRGERGRSRTRREVTRLVAADVDVDRAANNRPTSGTRKHPPVEAVEPCPSPACMNDPAGHHRPRPRGSPLRPADLARGIRRGRRRTRPHPRRLQGARRGKGGSARRFRGTQERNNRGIHRRGCRLRLGAPGADTGMRKPLRGCELVTALRAGQQPTNALIEGRPRR